MSLCSKPLSEADKLFLQQILFNLPEAALLVDSFGAIKYINDYGCVLFGYDREELTNQPLSILVPERCRAVHEKFVEHFLKCPSIRVTDINDLNSEMVALHKTGLEFPILISIAPIKHEERGILILVTIRKS